MLACLNRDDNFSEGRTPFRHFGERHGARRSPDNGPPFYASVLALCTVVYPIGNGPTRITVRLQPRAVEQIQLYGKLPVVALCALISCELDSPIRVTLDICNTRRRLRGA